MFLFGELDKIYQTVGGLFLDELCAETACNLPPPSKVLSLFGVDGVFTRELRLERGGDAS